MMRTAVPFLFAVCLGGAVAHADDLVKTLQTSEFKYEIVAAIEELVDEPERAIPALPAIFRWLCEIEVNKAAGPLFEALGPVAVEAGVEAYAQPKPPRCVERFLIHAHEQNPQALAPFAARLHDGILLALVRDDQIYHRQTIKLAGLLGADAAPLVPSVIDACDAGMVRIENVAALIRASEYSDWLALLESVQCTRHSPSAVRYLTATIPAAPSIDLVEDLFRLNVDHECEEMFKGILARMPALPEPILVQLLERDSHGAHLYAYQGLAKLGADSEPHTPMIRRYRQCCVNDGSARKALEQIREALLRDLQQSAEAGDEVAKRTRETIALLQPDRADDRKRLFLPEWIQRVLELRRRPTLLTEHEFMLTTRNVGQTEEVGVDALLVEIQTHPSVESIQLLGGKLALKDRRPPNVVRLTGPVPRAAPRLLAELQRDASFDVRLAAGMALLRMGLPNEDTAAAVAPQIRASRLSWLRQAFSEASPRDALQLYRSQAASVEARDRVWAAQAMATLPTEMVLEDLLRLSDDQSSSVGKHAIRSLGLSTPRDARILARLLRAISQPEEELFDAASLALLDLGPQAAQGATEICAAFTHRLETHQTAYTLLKLLVQLNVVELELVAGVLPRCRPREIAWAVRNWPREGPGAKALPTMLKTLTGHQNRAIQVLAQTQLAKLAAGENE